MRLIGHLISILLGLILAAIIIVYKSDRPLCPEYYSILYSPTGEVICIAPEPKREPMNPPVYDPKLRKKEF